MVDGYLHIQYYNKYQINNKLLNLVQYFGYL